MWYYLVVLQVVGSGYVNSYTIGEFKGEKACMEAAIQISAAANAAKGRTLPSFRCVAQGAF